MKTKSSFRRANRSRATRTAEEILSALLELNLSRLAMGQTAKAENETEDEDD
jgi:hypothetical protein